MSGAIIILAAGESKRLGQPKQLLPRGGKTLLGRVSQVALDAALGKVLVVLGAMAEDCRAAIKGMPIETVLNPRWAEGMGGSIAAGMAALEGDPLDFVILMVGDQPRIPARTLVDLRDEQTRTGACIVAARYDADTAGVPALFTNACFPKLAALRGHRGARDLISNEASLATVDCPEAAFDIDTLADWQRLSSE